MRSVVVALTISGPVASTRRESTPTVPSRDRRDVFLIRTTAFDDLSKIACILATASSAAAASGRRKQRNNPWHAWRTKIDNLFAQSDIEALITSRYHVLCQGHKAHRKVVQAIQSLNNINDNDTFHDRRRKLSDSELSKLFWTHASHSFHTHLSKAIRITGEDHVWKTHSLHMPPPSLSWLRHWQLTAYSPSRTEEEVIGFCELAVLWNPVHQTYSPAIVNLATAPSWRRMGVATRMIQSAERFVAMYWDNDCFDRETTEKSNTEKAMHSLGLYVEQDNVGALALYERLGFEIAVSCAGGEVLGDMWYMLKIFPPRSRQQRQFDFHSLNSNNPRESDRIIDVPMIE